MPKRSRKKPQGANRDVNVVAFDAAQRVIALIKGDDDKLQQVMERARKQGKDPLAAALGHRGGLKGGRARLRTMTKEQRRASALKAARARWDKRKSR
jgi:hypothetical protein